MADNRDNREANRLALEDFYGTDASHVPDSTADHVIVLEQDDATHPFVD